MIHDLRFGPQLPDDVASLVGTGLPSTSHHVNPLEGVSQVTNDPNFNYMYFVKIVPTSYLPLGWEPTRYAADESAEMASTGIALDGSIETHQYSVTSHKRSMKGGDDLAEGHGERLHSKGGIPGVFFSYVSLCDLV